MLRANNTSVNEGNIYIIYNLLIYIIYNQVIYIIYMCVCVCVYNQVIFVT